MSTKTNTDVNFASPSQEMEYSKLRPLDDSDWDAIEEGVILMLKAGYDSLRHMHPDIDLKKTILGPGSHGCAGGDYCEAFGVLRALKVMGHGKFDAVNIPETRQNLSWWFDQIHRQVRREILGDDLEGALMVLRQKFQITKQIKMRQSLDKSMIEPLTEEHGLDRDSKDELRFWDSIAVSASREYLSTKVDGYGYFNIAPLANKLVSDRREFIEELKSRQSLRKDEG